MPLPLSSISINTILCGTRDPRIAEILISDLWTLSGNNQDAIRFHNILVLLLDTYVSSADKLNISQPTKDDDCIIYSIQLPPKDQCRASTLEAAAVILLDRRHALRSTVTYDPKSQCVSLNFVCWRENVVAAEKHRPTPHVPLRLAVKRKKYHLDFLRSRAAEQLVRGMIDDVLQSKRAMNDVSFELATAKVTDGSNALVFHKYGTVTFAFLYYFYDKYKHHVEDVIVIEDSLWVMLKDNESLFQSSNKKTL
jgi:hypothetical protein